MLRRLACAVSLLVVCSYGIAQVHAETWDAAAGWHTNHNLSTDTWQYFRTDPGVDGYTLNTTLEDWSGGQYAWKGWGSYVCNIPSMPNILDCAPDSQDVAVGWNSPINGAVQLSYSLAMPGDPTTVANSDGVEYWVCQGATQLRHGYVTPGQSTGVVTLANHLSVAEGEKLYLRIGKNGRIGYDDTKFNMTVTTVPEPAAIVLLATGLVGLLVGFWRKRK
jgi:hypothetical protein